MKITIWKFKLHFTAHNFSVLVEQQAASEQSRAFSSKTMRYFSHGLVETAPMPKQPVDSGLMFC